MTRPDEEIAYVHARCKVETEKAILCDLETGEELWVPKSLIREDSQVTSKGDEGELAIPWWFAEREGVV